MKYCLVIESGDPGVFRVFVLFWPLHFAVRYFAIFAEREKICPSAGGVLDNNFKKGHYNDTERYERAKQGNKGQGV